MSSTNSNKQTSNEQCDGDVVLHGYHKKLKTMKKKYFVLYEENGKNPARLEYFDNEKKFKSKTTPKRIIELNSCFNINRRLDTKHSYVITLSTKDGGFGMVMDTEEDMNDWLRAMLKLQSGQNVSGPPRPFYEHVWQVVVQRKGLAEKKGILGNYHVCLSSKSVTLIRIGQERTNIGETRVPLIEFFLTSIRRCGDSKCYFYMEVGRHSVVGAGELWMETKDALIAQNMHTMILNVMSSNAEDPYGPMRKRSSSATETSKPVSILQRRQTHSGGKIVNSSSPLGTMNRDRCDSLPSSRNRTITESGYNKSDNLSMPASRTTLSLNSVPNSIYNRRSHSPPMNNNALSPTANFSESDGSTLSIDEPDSIKHGLPTDENMGFVSRFYNSHSPGGVIPEENADEFWYTENKNQNYIVEPSSLDKLNVHTGDGFSNSAPLENRKTLPSTSKNLSVDTESQYMDMSTSISPCENLCCDTNASTVAEGNLRSCNESSYGNSRASSLTEEIVDGYVHMSPQTSDYVDMDPMKNKRTHFNLSSTSSFVPGIALKDMSFEEYPIETANPRILSDEDEVEPFNERPPRAYSVGSRTEHHKQKLRIEVLSNIDQNNCRVRAFSVGSRSKVPRCDLQRNILLASALNSSKKSNVTNSKSSISSTEPSSESAVKGRKSSSAPLLIHKSQNSVDRMDDLMEIDFSKNSSSGSNSYSLHPSGASSSYPINTSKVSHLRGSILSSSPGRSALNNRSQESFSDSNQYRRENGYLEMRPVFYSQNTDNFNESADHFSSPNESSVPDIVHTKTTATSSQPIDLPTKTKKEDSYKMETPEGYLEMSWSGNKDNKENSHFVPSKISANNTFSLNDFTNTGTKSRQLASLTEVKKSRIVNKMPSSRTTATNNNSKLTYLQEKNQAAALLKEKLDINQRKRLSDHTISEEKTANIEQENLLEEFKNLSFQSPLRGATNSDYVNVDPSASTSDADSNPYVNFSPGAITTENEKDTNESEQLKSTSRESFDSNSSLNKIDKKSSKQRDSPLEDGDKSRISSTTKCTSQSPYSSCARIHRFNETNRQIKDSGYELLHICSDSSLQTRKSLSRPSSVNSDRILPLESTHYRPISANNDCLQLNSVPSSTSTLNTSSLLSQNNFDNRTQAPVNFNNNEKNTDSVSPKGLKQHNNISNDIASPLSSPVSKTACQPSNKNALELHYASLDLPKSTIKNSNKTLHGSLINPARSSTSDDISTRLCPNSNTSQQSAFTYAKIDFNQCEIKKIKLGTQNNL